MKSYLDGRTIHQAPLAKAVHLLLFIAIVAVKAQGMMGLVTQNIELTSGWNAVFVEVDPMLTSTADLFREVPVDVVAGFSSAAKPAQFVVDPSSDMLKAYGWNVWYSPRRADHFLSNLGVIQGGKPYLIHATTNTRLVIEGTIAPD